MAKKKANPKSEACIYRGKHEWDDDGKHSHYSRFECELKGMMVSPSECRNCKHRVTDG